MLTDTTSSPVYPTTPVVTATAATRSDATRSDVTTAHGTSRIQELDALRGIAALMVVLFHFTMLRPGTPYIFRFGVTGVDLFFMISGYVIFLTINRVRDWRDFVVSRVARLYPAYWTAVLLTAGLLYLFDRPHFYPKSSLVNLTMLQNFVGVGDLDGAYWTLAVELLFYGLMLLLLVTAQLQAIEKWGTIFLGCLLVFHFTGSAYFNNLYKLIRDDLPLVSHAPLFFSGILFYNLQHRQPNGLRHLGIAGCLLFAGYLHDKGGTAMGSITAPEHYLVLLGYVVVFYLFVHQKLRFLVNRYTLFLGTISYSLYLIHYTLCVKVIMAQLESWGWSLVPASAVALAVALLVASAITFLIERPANDAIRSRYKTWARKGQSAVQERIATSS